MRKCKCWSVVLLTITVLIYSCSAQQEVPGGSITHGEETEKFEKNNQTNWLKNFDLQFAKFRIISLKINQVKCKFCDT